MAIVGKTNTSPGYRRSRLLLTAVMGLYFVYTFVPILYEIAASTQTEAKAVVERTYKALNAHADMGKYCADHIAAYQDLEIS